MCVNVKFAATTRGRVYALFEVQMRVVSMTIMVAASLAGCSILFPIEDQTQAQPRQPDATFAAEAGQSTPDAGIADAGVADASVPMMIDASALSPYQIAVAQDLPIAYFTFDDAAKRDVNLVPGSPIVCARVGNHTFSPGRIVTGLTFYNPSGMLQVSPLSETFSVAAHTFEAFVRITPGQGVPPTTLFRYGYDTPVKSGDLSRFTADASISPFTLFHETWNGSAPGRLLGYSSGVVAGDQWLHYAFVYDGSQSHVYIDGNEVLPWQAGDGGARVAFSTKLVWGGFAGVIDEVAIYDKALSVSQIRRHNSL
jgi:hypothetical protein